LGATLVAASGETATRDSSDGLVSSLSGSDADSWT
jgi:hypothetical protein